MNNLTNTNSELSLVLENKGIDEATWGALTSSVFPGAETASIILAADYCKARGLDILKKPVHIVPMNVKDSKTGKYGWRDVIMPGIAEARITAYRTNEYVGQDAPQFGEMIEMRFGGQTITAPESCTVTVYRMIMGVKAAFPHTEFFEEAAATKKDGGLNSMWSTRKRGQLAKCAEAGALRKAFPEELGGITTSDEMEGREKPAERNITPRTEPIDPFKSQPKIDQAEATQEVKTETPESAPVREQAPTPIEVTIAAYKLLEGVSEKTGKAWKIHALTLNDGKNAVEAKTFSNTIGGIAEFNVGSKALVTLEKTPKGLGVLTLEVAETAVEGSLC